MFIMIFLNDASFNPFLDVCILLCSLVLKCVLKTTPKNNRKMRRNFRESQIGINILCALYMMEKCLYVMEKQNIIVKVDVYVVPF